MLSENSYEDSLDDSLQPSQLKSIEAEFETNKLYRLTYSSEEEYSNRNHEPLKKVKEHISQNNFAQAYQELLALNRDDAEYYYCWVRVNYALSKYTQLFKVAQKIIYTENEYTMPTLEILVEASLKIKQYEEALEYQLQLINRTSESGINNKYQIRLGEIYRALDRPQQAYYSYLCAYKNGEKNVLDDLTLLSYEQDQEQFLKFAKLYIEQLNKQCYNQMKATRILFYLSRVSKEIEYQQQGTDMMIQQNGMKSIETFKALANLAEMKLQKGRYSEALRDFELATSIILQLEGTQNRYYFACLQRISECFYRSGLFTQSWENLEKLSELRPNDGTILVNMIGLAIKLKRDPQTLLRQLEVFGNAVLLNEAGVLLQEGGMIDLAMESYRKALENAQTGQRVLISLNLAGCLGIRKDWQGAIEFYNEAGRYLEGSQLVEVEYRLGMVYRECGRRREGLFHLKKALELSGGSEKIQAAINQF